MLREILLKINVIPFRWEPQGTLQSSLPPSCSYVTTSKWWCVLCDINTHTETHVCELSYLPWQGYQVCLITGTKLATWNWRLNQSCETFLLSIIGLQRKITCRVKHENSYRTEPWVLKAVCLTMKATILSAAKNTKVGQAIGGKF